ncbi:MAG: TackOD1 domain-containing metal-binding protein [Candidatus Methanomethylicaceae archaeon]
MKAVTYPPPRGSYYSTIARDVKLVHLFEHLVKEGKDVLLPVFDPCNGYVYPDIINSCEVSPQESLELINKILSLGLGTKEYHDQVLRCPYCGSEQIRVYFHCPFCNSTQLYKELLLEHIRDGVIGALSKFKDASGTLVCPSCGSKLYTEGRDYRTVGVWYRCLTCYRQMDAPKITYLCRECKKEVTAHGLVISSVGRLIINKAALEEFSREHLAIKPIVDALKEAEYIVNAPGSLLGKSGVSHSFDIVGAKSSNIITIDVVVSKEAINEGAIVNLFVKVLDTRPTKAVLVCIPGILESAKKLANLYGITILEGTSISDIVTLLKSMLLSELTAVT